MKKTTFIPVCSRRRRSAHSLSFRSGEHIYRNSQPIAETLYPCYRRLLSPRLYGRLIRKCQALDTSPRYEVNYPLPGGYFLLILALTRNPDPIRPTRRGPEWPKFIFRNFSLCRRWLLVWCLECAEVNTSPQFLKTYTGYLLVSE